MSPRKTPWIVFCLHVCLFLFATCATSTSMRRAYQIEFGLRYTPKISPSWLCVICRLAQSHSPTPHIHLSPRTVPQPYTSYPNSQSPYSPTALHLIPKPSVPAQSQSPTPHTQTLSPRTVPQPYTSYPNPQSSYTLSHSPTALHLIPKHSVPQSPCPTFGMPISAAEQPTCSRCCTYTSESQSCSVSCCCSEQLHSQFPYLR